MKTDAYQHCDLDEIFAAKLVESHEFRSWLLSRTKFARLWPIARLLSEERERMRAGAPWWRNAQEGERGLLTNMLLVFEVEQTLLRFALHVQSATRPETLDLCDFAAIRARAQTLVNQKRALAYMDFETVLLAPQALIVGDARTLNFDRRIPFETVAGFVPQFGQAQRVAA